MFPILRKQTKGKIIELTTNTLNIFITIYFLD